MEMPIKKYIINEIKNTMLREINIKNVHSFNLISERVLSELPAKCIKIIILKYNALLSNILISKILKVAQTVMNLKLGRKAAEITSYRPINFLLMLPKVFEKIT